MAREPIIHAKHRKELVKEFSAIVSANAIVLASQDPSEFAPNDGDAYSPTYTILTVAGAMTTHLNVSPRGAWLFQRFADVKRAVACKALTGYQVGASLNPYSGKFNGYAPADGTTICVGPTTFLRDNFTLWLKAVTPLPADVNDGVARAALYELMEAAQNGVKTINHYQKNIPALIAWAEEIEKTGTSWPSSSGWRLSDAAARAREYMRAYNGDYDRAHLILFAAHECECGARFFAFYQDKPEELRNWAKRIESNWAPNSVSVPALSLARVSEIGATLLKESA